MAPPAILLTDLVKRYGGQAALDGVSLTVPAGQFMALVGASGSGIGVGVSDIRASSSWQAPPSMNSCCSNRKRWNGIRVTGPSIRYSSRARIMRRRAAWLQAHVDLYRALGGGWNP